MVYSLLASEAEKSVASSLNPTSSPEKTVARS